MVNITRLPPGGVLHKSPKVRCIWHGNTYAEERVIGHAVIAAVKWVDCDTDALQFALQVFGES